MNIQTLQPTYSPSAAPQRDRLAERKDRPPEREKRASDEPKAQAKISTRATDIQRPPVASPHKISAPNQRAIETFITVKYAEQSGSIVDTYA